MSVQLLVAQQVPEVLKQTKWYTDTVAQGLYIGQYQWDDYWTYSMATGYSDLGDLGSTQLGTDEGWLVTLMAKVQF